MFKTIKIVSVPSLTYVLLTDQKARDTITEIRGNIVDITKTGIGIVSDTVESIKNGADIVRQLGALQTSFAISSVFTIIYYLYINGKRETTKKRKRK